MFRLKIKVERLVLAIVLMFIFADSVPHPGLSAGILQTLFSQKADLQESQTFPVD